MVSTDTVRGIARERLHLLFEQARKQFDTNPAYAHRYMEIARNVAMKASISLPTELRRRMCRSCGSYLAYGKNAATRLDSDQQVKTIRCQECGDTMHIPYSSKKQGGGPGEEPGE